MTERSIGMTGTGLEAADEEGPTRDAFNNSPFLFESPVGVWETTRPDGSKRVMRHMADFTTRSETGEVIGHWTVQGPLTCMRSLAAPEQARCFVIAEDTSLPSPELHDAQGVRSITYVVASPLRSDGTRSLTAPDGTVSTTRRIG